MPDQVDREVLIARLVALHGGRAYARRMYERFSDDGLVQAVEMEEAAARDIARYGRLGAVWRDSGGEIVERAKPEAPEEGSET